MGRRKRGKRMTSKPVEDLEETSTDLQIMSSNKRKRFVPVKRPVSGSNELSEVVIFNSSVVPFTTISDILESTSSVITDDSKHVQIQPEPSSETTPNSPSSVFISKPGLFVAIKLGNHETESKFPEAEKLEETVTAETPDIASPKGTCKLDEASTSSYRPLTRLAKRNSVSQLTGGKNQLGNNKNKDKNLLHLLASAVASTKSNTETITRPLSPVFKEAPTSPLQTVRDTASDKQSEKSENMELDGESVLHSSKNQYLNRDLVSNKAQVIYDDSGKRKDVQEHVKTRSKSDVRKHNVSLPVCKATTEELLICELQTSKKQQPTAESKKTGIISKPVTRRTGLQIKANPKCSIPKDDEKKRSSMENSGNEIQNPNDLNTQTENQLADIRKWYSGNVVKNIIPCRLCEKAKYSEERKFDTSSSDDERTDSALSSCSCTDDSCSGSREDSGSDSDNPESNSGQNNVSVNCISDRVPCAEDISRCEIRKRVRKLCLDSIAKKKLNSSSCKKGFNETHTENFTYGENEGIAESGKEVKTDSASRTETKTAEVKDRKEHLSPTRSGIAERNGFSSATTLKANSTVTFPDPRGQNVPMNSYEEKYMSQEVKDGPKFPQPIEDGSLPANISCVQREMNMETVSENRIQNSNIAKPCKKAGISVEQVQEGTPGERTSKRVKIIVLKAERMCPIVDKQQSENHAPTSTSKMAAKDNVAVETHAREQMSSSFKLDVDGKIQPKRENKKSSDYSMAGKLQDEREKLSETAAELPIKEKEVSIVSDEAEKTDRFSLGVEQKDKDGCQMSVISESKLGERTKATDKEKMSPPTPYGLVNALEETVASSKVVWPLNIETESIHLVRATQEHCRMLHNESDTTCVNSPSTENPSILNAGSTKTGFSQQNPMMCTRISELKLRIQRSSSEESDAKENKLRLQDSWICQTDEHEPEDSSSIRELKSPRAQGAISPEIDNYSNINMFRESECDSPANVVASSNGESTETADEFYICSEDSSPLFRPIDRTPNSSDEVEEMVVDKWPRNEEHEGLTPSP